MYLAAAEDRLDLIEDGADPRPFSARWTDFPVSILSHHNQSCCHLAMEWLRSMDFAQLNGAALLSGPRWLRERYEWGPSAWPLHWCEAIDRDVIDCGAHAALANEVFAARGLTSFRAQFVQQYKEEAIGQWRRIWAEDGVSDHWLGNGFIYHEGNALLIGDGKVKLWDGSASCWINPTQSSGYGSLLAVRITPASDWDGPDRLQWGPTEIPLGQWCELAAKGVVRHREAIRA